MQKRGRLSYLLPILWGAVLIALIAAAMTLLRPAQPAAYTDAVYVSGARR